jgi:hypothetical protein
MDRAKQVHSAPLPAKNWLPWKRNACPTRFCSESSP